MLPIKFGMSDVRMSRMNDREGGGGRKRKRGEGGGGVAEGE